MTIDARDLGRDIGMIRLPLPIPGLQWTNAYVVRSGPEVTLIDCGVDTDEEWDALNAGLAALGLALPDLTRVIGTHLHPDHMALAYRVVGDVGCEFVMHESTAGSLVEYNDWNIERRRMRAMAIDNGVPDDEIAVAFPGEGKRPDWAGTGIPPTRTAADGDDIEIGEGRTLRVVHTPGHDNAHICLVDSRTGALFSGDHILPRITPVIMHHADEDRLGTYLVSLRRIEKMDLSLTYPAHVAILQQGSLRARQIALHHERRLGAMLQELRRGPRTAWHIVGAIFRPNLNSIGKRLALSETMTHMEYLRLNDEVERIEDEGTCYYRLPERKW
ncbi:MAG: MBL fold metallo-hydrolase [Acidimicrobiia bacterium]